MLVPVSVQVVSGPHKGKSLSLAVGAAEVRVGRNAPKKNGLRLDNDFEVSDKCVTLQVPSTGLFLHATSVYILYALLPLNFGKRNKRVSQNRVMEPVRQFRLRYLQRRLWC